MIHRLEPGGPKVLEGLRAECANDAAAMLWLEVGRNPHDPDLTQLVGELSTRSELFRERWASRDVVFQRSWFKRLHLPTTHVLDALASWAATHDEASAAESSAAAPGRRL